MNSGKYTPKTKLLALLACLSAASLLFVGCSSKPETAKYSQAGNNSGEQQSSFTGPNGPNGSTASPGASREQGDTEWEQVLAEFVALEDFSGARGEKGATERAGEIGPWRSYVVFWFDPKTSEMRIADEDIIAEIATYMDQNPSVKIGIDETLTSGADSSNRQMTDRRVISLRNALIQSGIPASQIEIGKFSDSREMNNRRVALMLKSAN